MSLSELIFSTRISFGIVLRLAESACLTRIRTCSHQVTDQVIEFAGRQTLPIICRHQRRLETIQIAQVQLLKKMKAAIFGLKLYREVVFVTNQALESITVGCSKHG